MQSNCHTQQLKSERPVTNGNVSNNSIRQVSSLKFGRDMTPVHVAYLDRLCKFNTTQFPLHSPIFITSLLHSVLICLFKFKSKFFTPL